jgi:hypothetical protein
VEWSTGRAVADALHFKVPAEAANRFAPAVGYAAGSPVAVIASGDLHGDGLPDVVVGGPGGVSLLRNAGGTFSAPVKLPVPVEATAIVIQDFNGDGRNDLAIAVSDGRVAILLNQGNGEFSAARYLPAGARPSAMVSADFNGDGIPDLAVANQDDNSVTVMLGNGDGTFHPAIAIPAGYSPRALVAADFNGDGLADLATANFGGNDISILLGDGTGGFRKAASVAAGNGPVNLAVADFNQDGAPDVAVLNQIDRTVSVLINDGSAALRLTSSIPDASALAVGDVDGDGYIDLVVQSGARVRVRPGRGDGSFGDGYGAAANASPVLLALADFNADGRLDVVAADLGGTLTVLSGTATTLPAAHIDTPASGSTVSGTITISCWAIDSTTTIAGVNICVDGGNCGGATYGSNRIDVCTAFPGRPGCPDVGFTFQMNTTGMTTGTHIITATAYDTDSTPDSATDSVTVTVVPPGPPAVYIDSLSPGATISGRVVVSGWAIDNATTVAAAISGVQIKVDGALAGTANYGITRSDVCAAFPGRSGCPNVGFTSSLNASSLSPGMHTITAVATDSDGSLDMGSYSLTVKVSTTASTITLASSQNPSSYLQSSTLTATVSPSFATGTVTFEDNGTVLGTRPLVNGQASLTTGQLASGTQSLKAYYSGSSAFSGSSSAILIQTVNAVPTTGFQSAVSYNADIGPYSIAVGDFNGDGKMDLVAVNNGSNDVSVFLGNGNGSFQSPVNFPTGGTSPTFVAVGDFNGDGNLDLVVFNSPTVLTGSLAVLLGKGDGTFQPAVVYAAGSGVESVAIGDFNGDGKLDLAFGVQNALNVLLGNGDGTFQPAVTSALNVGATSTGTVSLAVGDFNGDGVADLAVVINNVHAVGILLVALGNGDGTFQPGVGYNLGSSPLSIAVAVGDFNGDGRADLAVLNSSTSNVSVLLGNGDGTFRASVNYAANGPTWLAVGDFNGDGKADLAIANTGINSVSILAGVGDGTFQQASNYAVSADPRFLAVGDFNGDGRADVAVASTPGFMQGNGSISVLLSPTGGPPTVHIDSPAAGTVVSGIVTVTGWAIDTTAISNVQVQVDGAVVGSATYGTSRPDVCAAFPGRPGCPNVGFSYQLNTGSLTAGSHTLTLVATDTDAVPDSGSSTIQITVTGTPPTVHIDSPLAGAAVSGSVTISGWAIDNATTIGHVSVLLDGVLNGFATYGLPRPDVCATNLGRPGCPYVGFTYVLSLGTQVAPLNPGVHTITVVATDNDGTPDSSSYSVPITVGGPVVYVDSLAPGATVSGTVTVAGWAIDSASPIASVQVQVDGASVGAATYGTPRSDVCAAYPASQGCPNVGFTFQLNSTMPSSGVHNITIVAADSGGASGSYSLAVRK